MDKEFKSAVPVTFPISIIQIIDELRDKTGDSRAAFIRNIVIKELLNKKTGH